MNEPRIDTPAGRGWGMEGGDIGGGWLKGSTEGEENISVSS